MKRTFGWLVLAFLSVSAAILAQQPSGIPQSVWGTVRDSANKPIDGAVVSIRSVDQTFTTSVFADEKGEYVTPALPAGRYRMWAQATGYGTARAELMLDKAASQSFALQRLDDPGPQLTGTEWFDSLPAPSREDQRAKQALRVVCSDCHSLAVVLQNRFDERGWKIIINAMADSSHTGWNGTEAAKRASAPFKRSTLYHRDMIAAYLTKVRGPDSPSLTYQLQPRPRGDAARVVITDYDLPIAERPNELAGFDGSDWQEGPAVGTHGIVGPHDVLADKDGIAWIFEGRFSFETHRTVTRLDPKTGRMTYFAATMPTGQVLATEQMTIDPDGRLWADTSAGGGTRWSPPNGEMTFFAAPKGYPSFINSSDPDSQGRIWFNTIGGAARVDPTTNEWVQFKSPTPFDGFSYGMAVDADDNGWWSYWDGDMVGRADIKTGKIVEVSMHDPEYETRRALASPEDLKAYDEMGVLHPTRNGGLAVHPVPYMAAPRRMAADKKGRTVWVPNWAAGNIAEINIDTLKATFHKLPMSGQPYKTDVDNHHNVWATVPLADSLVKYDQATKRWTVYRYATHGCGPRHVGVDKWRDEVWVPCDQASKVSRFQFRSVQQIQSQMAAAKARR